MPRKWPNADCISLIVGRVRLRRQAGKVGRVANRSSTQFSASGPREAAAGSRKPLAADLFARAAHSLAAPVLEWALGRGSPSAHCVRSGHHILIGCDGAEGGIRTHTPCGATPSRWCVCQFRHFRTGRLRFVILAARLADGKPRCAACLAYGFFGCAGVGGGDAGGFCVEPAGDCFVELAGA